MFPWTWCLCGEKQKARCFATELVKFSVSYDFFVHNKAQKKMPRKNFMKSWLTYHAKNSEIKMSTATNILSCSISKILCKVRYTRLDIGVCRKLLSTGMFSTPYLMPPDVALQTLLEKGFVCLNHAGLGLWLLVRVLQSALRNPWRDPFLILAVLYRIRYMITKQIMQYKYMPKSRSNAAYPPLYALLFFLISKY